MFSQRHKGPETDPWEIAQVIALPMLTRPIIDRPAPESNEPHTREVRSRLTKTTSE
jgi:hypothetical protein